jgi:hypothetical protein
MSTVGNLYLLVPWVITNDIIEYTDLIYRMS